MLHNACVVYVPCASTAHAPVVAPQLYIGAGGGVGTSGGGVGGAGGAGGVGVGGTHVAVQLVFDSWPDPATHVLVFGSVHV